MMSADKYCGNRSGASSRTVFGIICHCVYLASLLLTGMSCQSESGKSGDTIQIGAILPFSGEQAALGINIEQALTLAVEDINKAGGVNGKPLELIIRDSNSGTETGYEQANDLLFNKKVKYLIGPEENSLAKELIADVKKADILQILPGIAAPSVRETGDKGAWIRLAPSPWNVGCAMAIKAIQENHETAAIIVSDDDYQMLVSAAFNSAFSQFGGVSLGTVMIENDQESYLKDLKSLYDLQPDFYAMLTYPKTGSRLTQEWVISGMKGDWYLAPTLHSDMFLKNIPFNAFKGLSIFSPSLSQPSECEIYSEDRPETLDCKRANSTRFKKHYQEAWQDTPLPTSFFYYDAVMLLALGLQLAFDDGNKTPTPVELRGYIKEVAESPGVTVKWSEPRKALKTVSSGDGAIYAGAAAEYTFSFRGELDIGEANHSAIDTWAIRNADFLWSDSLSLLCADPSYYGGRVIDADTEEE